MRIASSLFLLGLTAGIANVNAQNTFPSTGNVGIGMTSPVVSLVISGNNNSERIHVISSADPVVTVYHQNGTTSAPLPIVTGNNLGYFQFGGYDGTQNIRASWITGYSTENWTSATHGAGMIFSTTPNGSTTMTERMRLDQNGNLAIGTTSAGSNKLAVEGTIGARKVVVTQTNPFPDYVFEQGYQLPALDSVSKFIQANHHLPDVPSADSVARNGLDLGSNQAALLKKIEELTLYLIEQQDEIKKLKEHDMELQRRLDGLRRE